jgi:hypothetical protein
VSWFAYAFGDIQSISAEALDIIRARYMFCRSGIRGYNDAGMARHAIRADHIELAAPFAYQLLTIEGGFDPYYAAARRRLDALAVSRSI